jgi:two-component system sensor histidine kinase BaeS
MRLGLRSKLFIALLVTASVAVAGTSIAARAAFLKGFVGYLNEQEMTRIHGILRALAQQYRANGSWRFLEDDPEAWFEILAPLDFGQDGPVEPWTDGMPELGDFPPPLPRDLTGLGIRLALLDAATHFVVGNPAIVGEAPRQAVQLDGKVIGWLAVLPFARLTAGAAEEFQHRQLVSTWIIGLVAVGLAAGIAVLLTDHLLEPIRRIGTATHRLAAGDYATRLKVFPPDEIGRLAADFNRMALVLEKNEAMRRAFMADVSHELRTPIAVLRAELEAIEDRVRVPTPEVLRSLQAEVQMLGRLINDLSDLSLADVGALTYHISGTDVAALLRQRLSAFRERYAERGIIMETSLPEDAVVIAADELRIQQLFNNLIENSLCYTHSGGRFRASCLARHDAVVIDFQDSAPAVPEELLPRLFERFYRVDPSRNRATGGAGLGLAIAKSIVEAHGGTIRARSSLLGGLRICICLPFAR